MSVLESISVPNVRISNFLYEFTGIYDWKRPSIIYFWSKSAIGISSFRLPIYSIKRQNCNSIPAIDICRHVRFHRRWCMDLRASILVINSWFLSPSHVIMSDMYYSCSTKGDAFSKTVLHACSARLWQRITWIFTLGFWKWKAYVLGRMKVVSEAVYSQNLQPTKHSPG